MSGLDLATTLLAALALALLVREAKQFTAALEQVRAGRLAGSGATSGIGTVLSMPAFRGIVEDDVRASNRIGTTCHIAVVRCELPSDEIATRLAAAARGSEPVCAFDAGTACVLLHADRAAAVRAVHRLCGALDDVEELAVGVALVTLAEGADGATSVAGRRLAPAHRWAWVARQLDAPGATEEVAEPLFLTRRWPRPARYTIVTSILAPLTALVAMLLLGTHGDRVAALADVPLAVYAVATLACVAWLACSAGWIRRLPTSSLLSIAGACAAAAIVLHTGNAPQALWFPLTAVAALTLGAAVVASIDRLWMVIPICAISAISDISSVRSGPSSSALGVLNASTVAFDDVSATTLVQALVLDVSSPAGTWNIGAVDLLIVGMLGGIGDAWRLPPRRSFAAIVAAAAVAAGAGTAVPFVPVLVACWTAVHWRRIGDALGLTPTR